MTIDITQNRTNIFSIYASRQADGTYLGHVRHQIEGRPEMDRVYDSGVSGTEKEALEEAHAYAAKYIAEHNYDDLLDADMLSRSGS
ncbi:hypothetical protein [Undibacterium terreum]|uniref:Uncharacterized protein n=1 Tax=Undibacterium terreum TaxID=1224302 RepID=A0A916UEL6_9BURK|nr:hypothetical protein [Undibacterium terreum]GGC69551.1 hypothetical protein GCM10011396_15700 [Undibacterium terreum]